MWTTWHGWRCRSEIHVANSAAFGMVADRNTKCTCEGSRMMVSSQTTPRSLSRM